MTNNDVYFVGTMMGEKDFSDEFIANGQWQLGWVGQEDNEQYQKMLALLNEIKIGDAVILKSTYTRTHELPFENYNDKSVSVMKLKKLGHVKQNPHDGHNLFINWETDFKSREWYFYTNRQTIWKVSDSDKIADTSQLIQFALNNVKQDYNYFLNKSGLISNNHRTIPTELQNRKQDFLDFYDQGKWTAAIPKANWLSGYWDDKENYQRIKLVSIRQLLSYIKSLTETDKEAIKLIPDNLFAIATSDEFLKISDLINGIILNHHQEMNAIIDDLNIVKGNGRHGWNYSNFKIRNWYQDYQKYLSQHDRKGDKDMHMKESELLLNSKNMILRGAPGTGKTFLAKSMAADIISNGETTDVNNLSEEQQKQIGFVQFHPSYDYTDFVEGLRPLADADGNMGFELKNGVFTEFIRKARQNLELSQKSDEEQTLENDTKILLNAYIETITIGESKLKLQEGSEFYFDTIDNDKINLIAPRSNISHKVVLKTNYLLKMLASFDSDFSRPKDVSDFFKKYNIIQRQENSYYFSIYKDIRENQQKLKNHERKSPVNKKPFVFIIDEINRGEISKIFGELFYSIDPGYRGETGAVSTQYANLHDDPSEMFFVPENVYIIGTMNDIDRSVDSFDFAMRRRFRFVEIKASDQLKMLDTLEDSVREQAIKKLTDLNNEISATEELNENYQIGPSYFLKLEQIDFDELWNDYLQPLLEEYIRGMYNESEIMDRFQAAYYQKSTQDENDTNY
ncbi:hypothetical protein GCM10025879_01590 [Leuconostoc litchii]|uniref:AAA+ ATPase domain-containing protein n=1 Tax=Leuconostoc litchii TaxID=1981069 RepID=A0A6P2CLU0_9LACO|nr:AAA family ATPase [Leuconostoc litchii]TYC46998.1 hypothetical protein ESZ47_02335 [Leuconostoc litchii]GMA68913.1 hypothetical protein GCM10025879_01590 [Leuconostoc litchii]